MTNYRIALQPQPDTPPASCHTHLVRASVGEYVVETRHYSERDAQREVEWRAAHGERAEVICKSN